MGRKSQFTKEGKIKIIQRYDNDEGPQETLGKEISADNKTIKNWIDRYHAYGESVVLCQYSGLIKYKSSVSFN